MKTLAHRTKYKNMVIFLAMYLYDTRMTLIALHGQRLISVKRPDGQELLVMNAHIIRQISVLTGPGAVAPTH